MLLISAEKLLKTDLWNKNKLNSAHGYQHLPPEMKGIFFKKRSHTESVKMKPPFCIVIKIMLAE